jgi:hypothetical protein
LARNDDQTTTSSNKSRHDGFAAPIRGARIQPMKLL